MLATLNDVLLPAKKGGYAVGLFNTIDTDMLQAVIEAAEELRSPVIVGTAEILLPYGELSLIAPSVVECAKNAKVPVVVHYDHGLTKERCREALQRGFSSVMFDGSLGDYALNCSNTREIVAYAHAMGATVEGEIGHVGTSGVQSDADRYTTIEEAEDFLNATGVDALAVAVGTVHGVYRQEPRLDFERLALLNKKLNAPLVIHGGSGLTDDDFRRLITCGAAKINIFTDLTLAGRRAMQEGLKADMDYLDLRNHKVDTIKQDVMKKIKLFGSAGRA